MSDLKTCKKCGIEKVVGEFRPQRSSCKNCEVEYTREYNRVNAERKREYQREYRRVNAERNREYRRVNAERDREYRREYYRVNAERKREYQREYSRVNAERTRAYSREYAKTSQGRAVCRDNKARRRARIAGLPHVPWTLEEIIGRDLESYGFVSCWMCGVELCDEDSPHLDHLVPVAADPMQLRALGVDNPGDVSENLELACGPCNSRKSNKVMMCAVARYLMNSVVVECAS